MHRHSRRGFLARTLGASWAGLSLLERSSLRAAQARATATAQPLPKLFDIEKVADGIYAAIARPRAIINCNAVIFESTTGLMIVDAHSEPSAVASLVAQVRREIGSKPVRHVVTTHMHGDHTQGLGGYRVAASGAEIVSSTKTRDLMAELNPGRLKAALESAARSVDSYEKRLGSSKNAQEQQWLREMISQTRAFLAEMKNVEVELPGITFDRDMVIHDKAHTLHLAFRGRAHTAGDIVVHCPEKRVLASGDLCHSFFPTIGDGYPRDWPTTLQATSEFGFDHLVGGHGGIQQSRQRMDQLRAYMEELVEAVSRAKQGGRTLEQVREEVTPASLRALANGYADFLVGEVKQHDFRVTLNTPQEVLQRNVADNVASVFRNLDRN